MKNNENNKPIEDFVDENFLIETEFKMKQIRELKDVLIELLIKDLNVNMFSHELDPQAQDSKINKNKINTKIEELFELKKVTKTILISNIKRLKLTLDYVTDKENTKCLQTILSQKEANLAEIEFSDSFTTPESELDKFKKKHSNFNYTDKMVELGKKNIEIQKSMRHEKIKNDVRDIRLLKDKDRESIPDNVIFFDNIDPIKKSFSTSIKRLKIEKRNFLRNDIADEISRKRRKIERELEILRLQYEFTKLSLSKFDHDARRNKVDKLMYEGY